jgi:hypothetical protein
MTREDDVRAAGEPADVEAEAQAVAMEGGADEELGRGVMAADGGHDARAGGGGGKRVGFQRKLMLGLSAMRSARGHRDIRNPVGIKSPEQIMRDASKEVAGSLSPVLRTKVPAMNKPTTLM